jgi:hypothetical protein
MTQQEIQDRNKEIALMLGKKYQNNKIVIHYNNVCGVNPTGETWQECLYHSDWNWLMEAVEFIEKKIKVNSEYASNYNVVFDSLSCSIETTGYHQKTIINVNNQNRKEAVFLAISEFAKSYNNKEL